MLQEKKVAIIHYTIISTFSTFVFQCNKFIIYESSKHGITHF